MKILRILYNFIPKWIKILLLILLLTVKFWLPLINWEYVLSINYVFYYKLFAYPLIIIIIFYYIIELYLLNLFYKNNSITIPEILPNFLINYLKTFKNLNKSTFDYYKKDCYIQLGIYIGLIIISLINYLF